MISSRPSHGQMAPPSPIKPCHQLVVPRRQNVVYGLPRNLNAQGLAKGQLGLPITIEHQITMGTIHYLKYYNTITGLAGLLDMRRWISPKVTNTTGSKLLSLHFDKGIAMLVWRLNFSCLDEAGS